MRSYALRLSAAVGAGLLIAAWAAVSPSTAAPVVEDPTVRLTIDSFVPVAPKPGDDVTISGIVVNTSGVALGGNPQVLACIEPKRMTTRAELAAVSDDPSRCAGREGPIAFQRFESDLLPGGSVRFSLDVPWESWGIGHAAGVYVVGVYFRANPPEGDRLTAGRARTLMPVVPPDPDLRKVRTAMVLPLRHRPTQLGGQRFANEALAESMRPTGRLGRQLQAGTAPKVTWLADPSLLAEAREMSDGYEVLSPDNKLTAGANAQGVKDWLDRFDQAREQDPVVLLPYGDPDVASLVDNGLKNLVTEARAETAKFNFADGPAASSGLWLEAGSATGKNLVAGTIGYRGRASTDLTIVSNWSWPVGERPSLLPSPVLSVATPDGPVRSTRTIVSDAALTAGGPDPATATSPVQMRQRFAAETALLAATPGSGPLTVVGVPPRGFDATGLGTQGLLQGLSLPWIQQIGLNEVTAATPAPARTPTMPRTSPGLNDSQIQQIKQLNRLIDTYGSLVTDRQTAVGHLERLLLRASSTTWRGWLQQAQRFLTFQIRTVTGQLSKVHLVSAGQPESNRRRPIQVTLSGRNGRFPLTIANELEQSVRVGVQVRSQNRSDLRIEPLRTVTLAAKQKATFQVEASAQQNGLIQASVQVVTAGGAPVGREQKLVILAAQYGNVGWILVGTAVALLFGTSLIRIYRRIRNERRNPGPRTDAPAGDVPETVREGAGTTDG